MVEEPNPLPCPNCGKVPKVEWEHEGGVVEGYLNTNHQVICRKWLGLRVCNRGPLNSVDHNWADWGKRAAIAKWNEQVSGKKEMSNLEKWLWSD